MDTIQRQSIDQNLRKLVLAYPTLMLSLKKFSPESIKAIARNPNIGYPNIQNQISNTTLEHNNSKNC